MFLYNVTVGIDREVEAEWLQWMKGEHVGDIMSTGLFASVRIYKVLHDNEDATTSYSVQCFAETISHVQQYLDQYAPAHAEELHRLFKDRHVAFRTLLQEV